MLRSEVRPMPYRMMMNSRIAELADDIHARRNFGPSPNRTRHFRKHAFDNLVPDFVVADIEKAGPETEAEFRDEVWLGDRSSPCHETLLRCRDGLALLSGEKRCTVLEPLRARKCRDFSMDCVSESDFEDLKSGIQSLAKGSVPKVALKRTDLATAFCSVGSESRG
jgi:hypothetical protein